MAEAHDPLRVALEDRLQFETVVADLASRFVNLDSDLVDGAIEDALQRLVLALDIDRSSLVRFDGEGAAVFTHSWARPEFPPAFALLQMGQPSTEFPWAEARLRRGEIVCFSSVDDLPADAPDREAIQRVGTKSTVAIPLIVSGRVIGALTFARYRRNAPGRPNWSTACDSSARSSPARWRGSEPKASGAGRSPKTRGCAAASCGRTATCSRKSEIDTGHPK